ncbi:MAG: hypothetical protein ACLSFJ_07640 [Holdemania filiformis]
MKQKIFGLILMGTGILLVSLTLGSRILELNQRKTLIAQTRAVITQRVEEAQAAEFTGDSFSFAEGPALLRIPSLNLEEAVREGIAADTLKFSLGMEHRGSRKCGQLRDRRSPQCCRRILCDLPSIAIGDEVILEHGGRPLVYEVCRALTVTPQDDSCC